MVYKANVLYPSENIDFKMDYYLTTHMPFVSKSWAQYGLKRWEITKLESGQAGSNPLYAVQAVLTFGSEEDFQKAMKAPEAEAVFGDIPNFSNVQPVVLSGALVGSEDL